MSILLADNALLTLAEAREFLKLGDTLTVEQESLVNDVVNRVSSFIERFVNRPVRQRAYTSLRLPSRRSALLFPPAAPISIVQTITLSLDGTAQTVWKSEPDGDPADFEVEVRSLVPGADCGPDHFYRGNGWSSTRSGSPILLSYTGGFATIPERFKQAAREWLQEIYLNQTQRMTSVETITTPTGTFTKSMRAIPPRVEQLIGQDRLVSV